MKQSIKIHVVVVYHNILKNAPIPSSMNPKELSVLGLTEHQSRIFLKLIKEPGLTVSQISKKLRIDRSFTYNILDRLMDKGFVGVIVKNRRQCYFPSDPNLYIKELDEKRDASIKVIEELKLLKNQSKTNRTIRTYEGTDSLKVLIRELIAEKKFALLGGGGVLKTIDNLKYGMPHYVKEIKSKNIQGRVIATEKNIPRIKPIIKETRVRVKTIERKPTQANFVVFGDKIAIYTNYEEPYIIIIEDGQVAKSLESYFEYLWKIAK